MTIKILITSFLLFLGFFSFTQARQVRFLGAGVLATVSFGVYCTWNPDTATAIANVLGVGRGADLLLYAWVLTTAMLSVVFEVKIRAESARTTRLIRVLAIQQPLPPTGPEPSALPPATATPSGGDDADPGPRL